MTIAKALQKLFRLEGREFVSRLHTEIVERQPSEEEIEYYTKRLAHGIRKHELLAELMYGREAQSHNGDGKGPRGWYPTAQEWFARYSMEHPFPDPAARYIPFHLGEPSLDIGKCSVPCLFHPGEPPRQSVAVIPWGRVAGRSGGVMTTDGRLLWEVSVEFNKPHDPNFHSLNTSWDFPPASFLDESVGVLTSPGSTNYYHWMFDVLPRIELIRKAGIRVDRYLTNRLDRPYQWESLSRFGISRSQIMEVGEHSHLRARHLVVPSMAGFSGNPSKLACDLIRGRLLTNGGNKYRRLYISRAHGSRKIMNESEVTDLLHRFHFQRVVLETIPFADQIRLFEEAEAIVAPHGAGLANLVFCQPGAVAVELFHPEVVNCCYYALCQKVGVKHRGIVAYVGSSSDPTYQRGDIYVDVVRLQEELNDNGIYAG